MTVLSCNERITLRQLQMLIILSAMGTGLIVLPRRVAEYAAQDGWLIVLGLTALAMALTALIAAAARTKANASFVVYTGYALSRPVAHVCGVFLWVKLVLAAGLEMRSFLVITRQVLLKDTPVYIIAAVMVGVCAYAAVKGIETRARVAEVLGIVLVLPLIFLFVVALMDIDLSNLLPVFTASPERLLSGTLRLGFVFTGLECLLLVSTYVAPGKKMGRAAVGAVGLAGVIITAVTVITLAKFGASVADEPWPVLRMMDMLNLPGSFIERQEALMFSFWIVTVFTLVNALLFFGGTLLTDITSNNALSKSKKRIINTLITAIAVFAVTCMPWEGGGIYKRLDWLYYTSGTFFLLVLPLLIILGAKLRKWINGKSFLLLTLFIVPLLSFVGCYDRVEIEDRTFVVAFGIDKAEDDGDTIPYRYTMSVALSHNGSGGDDEKDDNKNQIKTASAQTLTEAIHLLNREANARLYYGQAKVIVLGSELLEDPALVKNAFIVLAQNEEIDRQIKIVSAEGKATDALKEKPHEKIPKANAVNYTPDFGEVHTQLKQSGCALIPVYSGGATALKDYKKTETLSAEELRGFLWCLPDKNKDAVITAGENDGKHISYKMKKHSVDISIEPSCPNPRVIIEVKAEGRLTEADGLAQPFAALLIEREIADEIRETVKKMQASNTDAYNWLDHLRKKQHDIYQELGHRWSDVFPRLVIVPRVTVCL